jgi:hypothetical protein
MFPGGRARGWEDRGETGYIAVVRERCVVWGGDGTEDITADVDRSAQWVRGLEECGGTVLATVAFAMIELQVQDN